MLDTYRGRLDQQLERWACQFRLALRQNARLLLWLGAVALAGYGFELFNFNLTIDEEVHAAFTGPTLAWLRQGRWGMYFLNRFLLPHTVIPFVPLFLALCFHVGAMVILLHGWGVRSGVVQGLVGAVGLAFPGLAYMYTFSTIGYGIGFGLLCVALSLFIFVRAHGLGRWLAVLPAAYALAIYQGFLPALAAVFLVSLVLTWKRTGRLAFAEAASMAGIHLAAVLVYFAIQRLILSTGIAADSGYVASFFDTAYLRAHAAVVLTKLSGFMVRVYGGDVSLYSVPIAMLGVVVGLSVLGFCLDIVRRRHLSVLAKAFLIGAGALLLCLPFASGLLLRGEMAMRFLVALPVVLAGLVVLGLGDNPKLFRALLALCVAVGLFQFVVATNRLFGASHLALQADRLLASRLVERIDMARAGAPEPEVRYLEIIGYPDRPATELMPKLETFGASFFDWDMGNPQRAILFLQTIGYTGLQALPAERRLDMVVVADAMPVWPQAGSVRIVDEAVLVKFGPYSYVQQQIICGVAGREPAKQAAGFCQ